MMSVADRVRLDEAVNTAATLRENVARLTADLSALTAAFEDLEKRFLNAILYEKAPPIPIPPFPKALKALGFKDPRAEARKEARKAREREAEDAA